MNAQAAVAQQQPANMMVEPPFLRENWKKVLASATREDLRVVRVTGRVASVTNSSILLRCPVDMPDGFYHVSNQNELFPTKAFGWMTYPDVEQVRPSFEAMKPLSLIARDATTAFITLCDAARAVHADILVDGRGMCFVQNSAHHVQCPLGVSGEGLIFNASHLKLALVEALRYDSVYLWKEERLDFSATPLVFGHNWGCCSLIQARTVY
jgi:hypothetical protein